MNPEAVVLIRGASIYAPLPLGVKDLLIAGGRVVSIEDQIDPAGLEVHQIDARGQLALPGLIDGHVHIAGAGGEGGPSTRTPEMQLSQMLSGGITTVIGCQGTDGITRNPESVLMKVKALRAEGVSAWMYTGSYQVPTPTITGSVGRDLSLIEEVIGVGEIALSDHRSSWPSTAELIRIAAESRVGAMLGGKSGVVNIHMGDARDPFHPIREAVEASELQFKQFLPTHCNRNSYIFEDAKIYGREGYLDLTTSSWPYFPEYEVKPSRALREWLDAGVPPEHITMTSDGNGSLPQFDEQGNLVRLEMGQPDSLFRELMDAVRDEELPLDVVLSTVTSNPARILGLKKKGMIACGMDADLVILDPEYSIRDVLAGGVPLVRNGELLRRGTYE